MKKTKTQLFSYLIVIGVLFLIGLIACEENNEPESDPNATKYEEVNGEVTVTDLGQGTGTITWTSDKVWILNGLVFVNSDQTLTIEAGTVIKGKPGMEADASALIVTRGGMISAIGTASNPIIFTAEADQLSGNIGKDQRGLWGGIIILGKASLNSNPGETAIEGIPTSESRGLYGGSDDTDNSGTLKYVSIRHGGTDIGEGNEINGLTLGGVGSGTTFEYIEVISNKDDGVEFFGGNPRLKYILVAYCGDDSYDYDEGFRGKGQFWVAIQDETGGAGDRLGEHDGGTDPETATPYAIPVIYNATYIGRGASAGKRVITFRDNAGGKYNNSIFANQAKGIDVEILIGEQNSYKQISDGNLEVKNCIFSDVAGGTAETIFKLSYVGDSLDNSGNKVTDNDDKQIPTLALLNKVDVNTPTWVAMFANNGNSTISGLVSATNPVPATGANNGVAPTDSWFTNITYQGAFDPGGTNWAAGWTLLFESK